MTSEMGRVANPSHPLVFVFSALKKNCPFCQLVHTHLDTYQTGKKMSSNPLKLKDQNAEKCNKCNKIQVVNILDLAAQIIS